MKQKKPLDSLGTLGDLFRDDLLVVREQLRQAKKNGRNRRLKGEETYAGSSQKDV